VSPNRAYEVDFRTPHDPADRNAIHREVAAATEGAGRYLFAVTPAVEGCLIRIRSDQPIARTPSSWVRSGECSPSHPAGASRRFMLEACVTRRPIDPDGIARRRGLAPAAAIDWLRARIEGATFDSVDAMALPTLTFEKRRDRVVLARTMFFGSLTVTDTDAFASLCSRGLGRGKAFGLGLFVTLDQDLSP
jgi:CRISPR-associated protein Cas6/Cse3/CasE subtype I-E